MFKKLFFVVSFTLISSYLYISLSFAVSYPQPQGYVSDYTNTLSLEFKSQLENSLKEYEKNTTNEIVVVMIDSLEGETIENYAVKLFEQWKIGKKGKDNGILLLIAKKDRKLRIEVGYGLEPLLTDAEAGGIIRNMITPEFQKGDYQTGILNGVSAIQKKLEGEIYPSGNLNSENTSKVSLIIIVIFLLFFWIIPMFLSFTYLLGRTKGIFLGGIIGGGVGAVVGLIFQSLLIGIFLAIILFIIGIVLDIICSFLYRYLKKTDRQSWLHGVLHTWSSGGRWGSGRGRIGGGFGGFGGGRSGGGGASGGW